MAGQRHRGAGRSRSALACSKSSCTASAGHQGDRCVEARGVLRRRADRLIAGATAGEGEVMDSQPPNTTTDAGSPVASDEYSLTAGPSGPNRLQDAYLLEKLAHFVRERVPDRVYHVKGGGAFGYFEVTADVTQWTKAAFFSQVGKRT